MIDFGLAKAMHQPLTEKTLYTAHETALGTPLYMSPEQAQLNNLDVDTRADIYSLGVLLYELLTGTTPLEGRRFKEAAWDEIRRMIREEEPPRPSLRLSSTDTLPSLATFRHTEPAKLKKLVDENPTVTRFRGRLAFILIHLGDTVRALGRSAAARGSYERAIALKEPWVREDPTNTEHRYVLICAVRRRGLALSDLGDPTGAAADIRRALKLCDGPPPRSSWGLFEIEMACFHAALAGLAGRAGSDVSAAKGKVEAAKAMEWLGRAVGNGYRNTNELRIESAFDPLRDRADFKKLVTELGKNPPAQNEKK